MGNAGKNVKLTSVEEAPLSHTTTYQTEVADDLLKVVWSLEGLHYLR